MSEIIYLAGPMRFHAEFNFPAFRQARERLRYVGYGVLCPAERDEALGFNPSGLTGHENLEEIGFSLPDAFTMCVRDVLMADAIAMLPGWQRSEGARAEFHIADLCGKTIYAYEPDFYKPLRRVWSKVITSVAYHEGNDQATGKKL